MKRYLTLIFLALISIQCHNHDKPLTAFYYWKTHFKLSEIEKKCLTENQVKKIYIRYFDIGINTETNQAFPISPIVFKQSTTGFIVVPVVYIKNEVMLNKAVNIAELVKKTANFIQQINTKNNIQIDEIQLDCDWTLASKANYLQFVNLFKKETNKKLSATIRLHQIKYFKKTSIPNVDKGVLMYYNMGKIAPDSLNSIYDKNIAERYLKSIKNYPLELNIALPIYSWGIHIRNEKVMALKSKMISAQLQIDTNFVAVKPNFYRAKNSHYKNGTFYMKNDLIKIEHILPEQLLEMATDIADHLNKLPQEVIFYDLDAFNTQHYEKSFFKKVTAAF